MPKKTRQEKIAAELHRLKKQLEGQPTIPAPKTTEPREPKSTPEPINTSTGISLKGLDVTTSPSTQFVNKETERYDYTYLARDLRKIALLAIAAVAIEIVLSLTTHASFAKLILRSFGLEI